MSKKKSTKVDEKKLAEFNETSKHYVSKEALQEAMDIVDSQDPLTEEEKRAIFGNEIVFGDGAQVALDEIKEKEKNGWVWRNREDGSMQLVSPNEIEEFEKVHKATNKVAGNLTDVYSSPEGRAEIEKWTMDVSEDGTIDVIPPDDIEDEVVNKVVLEQVIEQTLPHVIHTEGGPKDAAELKPAVFDQGFLASVNYTFDTDKDNTEEVTYYGSPNIWKGPEKPLPPVNSLVAPKSVKAIEQAPVVNNGGTVVPQAPQAQPVGRQRHTFKARPDKEGRNV